MQDWVDVNCYFTVGKTMLDGKVLYRDIFEQKGPVLYFIYCLVCTISTKSFIGVYIVELCCFTAFLYVVSKIFRLYNKNNVHLFWILLALAFVITTSRSFIHGGSVEELCFLCFAYVLYVVLKLIKNPQEHISRKKFFICGIMIGLTFWIKYTIVGIYIGSYLTLLIFLIKEKRAKDIFPVALYSFAGLVVASIPVFIYFIYNNALSDLMDVYFMHNINAYSAKATIFSRIKNIVEGVGRTVVSNVLFSLFVAIGGIWILRKKNFETLLFLLSTICYVCLVYIGDIRCIYYGLPLCIFSMFGFFCIADILDKFIDSSRRKFINIAVLVLIVILPIISLIISPSTYLMKYSKDDLPQYKFAKIINSKKDSTLFYYGSYDAGFYFAADKIPQNRIFSLHVRMTDEMKNSVESVVKDAKTDYIVSRDKRLENEFDDLQYKYIASETFRFEGTKGTMYTYHLYEKTEK